jgi:hypothetical protein
MGTVLMTEFFLTNYLDVGTDVTRSHLERVNHLLLLTIRIMAQLHINVILIVRIV